MTNIEILCPIIASWLFIDMQDLLDCYNKHHLNTSCQSNKYILTHYYKLHAMVKVIS